jgi:hypothetical protein
MAIVVTHEETYGVYSYPEFNLIKTITNRRLSKVRVHKDLILEIGTTGVMDFCISTVDGVELWRSTIESGWIDDISLTAYGDVIIARTGMYLPAIHLDVYDIETGSLKRSMAMNDCPIGSITTISSRFTAIRNINEIKIYNSVTGEPIMTIENTGDSRFMDKVSFSENEDRVFFTIGHMRLCSVSLVDGKRIEADGYTRIIQVSSCGRMIVESSDRKFSVLDSMTLEPLQTGLGFCQMTIFGELLFYENGEFYTIGEQREHVAFVNNVVAFCLSQNSVTSVLL